ncbi:uncharacterized protein LOC126988470 isoform X2 [Eriocheir sinensis]|uniref:uncharacterized protein LOC126988470 isoform X1 n=1 Tax=Eriocheir sinensis TaxID=95602 RepID=UPI0021C5B72B|nr:uncharacterized protein LOC126988470 isoform X1 [Eriocheir sinensis]XP_050702555.1 uncharacterized protein LOC126988470 isoform X2 [Eriocheir sinensis]
MCVFPLCGGRGQTKDTIIVSLGQALSSAQPGSGSTTTVPPPPPPDLSSASTEPAPCRPAQRPTRSSEAATMRWSLPALLLLPLLLTWDTTSVSRVCGRKTGDHPIQQPNPTSAPDLLSATRNPWIRRDQIPQPTTTAAGPDYPDVKTGHPKLPAQTRTAQFLEVHAVRDSHGSVRFEAIPVATEIRRMRPLDFYL